MKLTLNGADRELPAGATLTDLLLLAGLPPDRTGVAVARNGEVVRRAAWSVTILNEGDRIELVSATQGG
jgi:sulfur carrier protein